LVARPKKGLDNNTDCRPIYLTVASCAYDSEQYRVFAAENVS